MLLLCWPAGHTDTPESRAVRSSPLALLLGSETNTFACLGSKLSFQQCSIDSCLGRSDMFCTTSSSCSHGILKTQIIRSLRLRCMRTDLQQYTDCGVHLSCPKPFSIYLVLFLSVTGAESSCQGLECYVAVHLRGAKHMTEKNLSRSENVFGSFLEAQGAS